MSSLSSQSHHRSTHSNIFTVSRLNADVRLLLESEMGIVWLVGEISNFSAPVSGHWYFSLKDARSQVKCAMFRGNNRRVTFKPSSGNQVLVKARISLYEPRGDFQLIVESMQPEGDGRIQQAFEQLKLQLASEGLFAQTEKQPLPEHPRQVGIITSQTGAALYDILDVLRRRDPNLPIVIYPTLVQGSDAAIEIAQAIGRANSRQECDVLIVGRGGGALEDLNCFNDEVVARTIAASSIPIISAVGHEVDVTIADLVADMRAPTPSAAAELVSRDQRHKRQAFDNQLARLQHAAHSYIAHSNARLQQQVHQLEKQHPSYRLEQQNQQLDELTSRLNLAALGWLRNQSNHLQRLEHQLQLRAPTAQLSQQRHRLIQIEQRLQNGINNQLLKDRHQLALAAETLDAVSPLATLKRGYSITKRTDGQVIKHVKSVKPGDQLVTQLVDGEIYSTVHSE